jgi:hypothetical protein
MRAKVTTLAVAGLLLFGGCVKTTGDYSSTDAVRVVLTATVTGKALVRWSDGTSTREVHIEEPGRHVFDSSVEDADRYVVAITVVPLTDGEKVSCRIDLGDRRGHVDFDDDVAVTDTTRRPGEAAVCMASGQVSNPSPEGARPVNVTANSRGGARWRAVGTNGAYKTENLTGPSEYTLSVLGALHAVVVATRPGDTISCGITGPAGGGATGTAELAASTASGLGAIATCSSSID